ncbi:MAG: glycosyltransferase family 4 protein [Bacteroidales bacterium]|nr:glycosyltransferase family 4 protein [Bacteroidales bacterium]
MKITFLTSGHLPHDDRIYWHMAQTLSESGHKIQIVSSKAERNEEKGSIVISSFNGDKLSGKAKIDAFIARLESFRPDRVICSEPLPVMAAARYRRKKAYNLKILYDITEWYPSARFLKNYPRVIKWFGFLKLLLANLAACMQADGFIFGEWYKSRLYRFFFPFKPNTFITYYPDLKYINHIEPSFTEKKLRLSYSGEISANKGFFNFMNVVNALADKQRDLSIEVKLIAWFEPGTDREKIEKCIASAAKNVFIIRMEKQELPSFTTAINDTDIFLELRQKTFENSYSLPIKLFYYAALGRPVIVSDLRAVRRDVSIDEFGYRVRPDDTAQILKIIEGYLADEKLYMAHCNIARKLSEQKYNWNIIAPEFLKFIESL